jgi:hypothetical protein
MRKIRNTPVTPAQAGAQTAANKRRRFATASFLCWVPAFAGMTYQILRSPL